MRTPTSACLPRPTERREEPWRAGAFQQQPGGKQPALATGVLFNAPDLLAQTGLALKQWREQSGNTPDVLFYPPSTKPDRRG